MAQRKASATWEGDLFKGSGVVSALSSGLFTDAAVTWPARTEDSGGLTSPEELIAAAHSACFCMALSNELSSRGHVPSKLQVEAICTFEDGKVTVMALDVSATIPGADESAFREGLDAAEGSCPVSNALRNNVAITVDGRLV
ncbi:MAG TPA: OsmC family peroxiredoxin [Acidimicrobiales bacterium]|nr:OsmC family peroxiredoxin [Acidimicrobiales bacterium]